MRSTPESSETAAEREAPTDQERASVKAERAARKALRATREAFFLHAQPLTPYVAVRIGDELFFLPTDDGGLSKGVFARMGRKDIAVLERAVTWLGENGVLQPAQPEFVDVGANVGTTTVVALRRRGFATAVALEPLPGNYRALRLNVVANELESRVQAVQVAVSDRDGELRLDVARLNKGGNRVAVDGAASSSKDRIVVRALTLDTLVARGVIRPEKTGLLWVDTPAHEGHVLTGATNLLERGTPLVVAIRPVRGREEQARPWDVPPEARASAIAALTASYTDIVELRKKSKQGRRRHPIDALPILVDSFRHCQDLLFVRR